jgi:hypothetical protein
MKVYAPRAIKDPARFPWREACLPRHPALRRRQLKNTWNGLRYVERKYDAHFKVVFDAIRELTAPPETKRKTIGLVVREKPAIYGTA